MDTFGEGTEPGHMSRSKSDRGGVADLWKNPLGSRKTDDYNNTAVKNCVFERDFVL